MSSAAVDFEGLYQRLAAAERALNEPSDAGREAVLQERALAMAKPRAQAPDVVLEVMAFRLAGERLAVELTAVEEVVECKALCPLPLSPHEVLGALSVRAGIVPVLDLRARLGLREGPMADLAFVLVVACGPHRFGLAVEDTDGALGLETKHLLPPPPGPFRAASSQGLKVLDLSCLTTP